MKCVGSCRWGACVCIRGGVDYMVVCTCKVGEGGHNGEATHGWLWLGGVNEDLIRQNMKTFPTIRPINKQCNL